MTSIITSTKVQAPAATAVLPRHTFQTPRVVAIRSGSAHGPLLAKVPAGR